MDATELGVGIFGSLMAIFVLAGAFLNILQSGILIIGAGTATSLVMASVRIVSERREGVRRRRTETIQRLQPMVCDPLMRWTVRAKEDLDRRKEYEISSYVESPPDLRENGDFVAIVGDILKDKLNETQKSFKQYDDLHTNVLLEYWTRFESLIDKKGLGWRSDSVYVTFAGQRFSVESIPTRDSLETVRELAEKSKNIVLSHNAEPKGSIPCPEEIKKAILIADDLKSFQEFNRARSSLNEGPQSLHSLLAEVIRKGERDWKV